MRYTLQFSFRQGSDAKSTLEIVPPRHALRLAIRHHSLISTFCSWLRLSINDSTVPSNEAPPAYTPGLVVNASAVPSDEASPPAYTPGPDINAYAVPIEAYMPDLGVITSAVPSNGAFAACAPSPALENALPTQDSRRAQGVACHNKTYERKGRIKATRVAIPSMSEQQASCRMKVINILSPRPTLWYCKSSCLTTATDTGPQGLLDCNQIPSDNLNERIGNLANGLSAKNLREVMERDQRMQELGWA